MNFDLRKSIVIMTGVYSNEFGIEIVLNDDGIAETDGHLIRIPKPKPEYLNLTWGYCAHEAAHCRFTEFKWFGIADKKSKLLLSVLNCIEDTRIEKLFLLHFPGTRSYFEALAVQVLKFHRDNDLNDREFTDPNIVGHLLSIYLFHYIRGKLTKYPNWDDTMLAIQRFLFENLDKDFLDGLITLMNRSVNVESTEDCYYLAEEIISYIGDYDNSLEPPCSKSSSGNYDSNAGTDSQSSEDGSSSDDSSEADANGQSNDDGSSSDDGSEADANGQSNDDGSSSDDGSEADANGQSSDDGSSSDDSSEADANGQSSDDGSSSDDSSEADANGQSNDDGSSSDDGSEADANGQSSDDGSSSDNGSEADANGQSNDDGSSSDDGSEADANGQSNDDGSSSDDGSEADANGQSNDDGSSSDNGSEAQAGGTKLKSNIINGFFDQQSETDTGKMASEILSDPKKHDDLSALESAYVLTNNEQQPSIESAKMDEFESFACQTSSSLQHSLVRLIQDKTRSQRAIVKRGRRIAKGKSHRLMTGDTRIFKRKFRERDEVSCDLVVLADSSSSLDEFEIEQVKVATYSLLSSLNRIDGTTTSAYSFCDDGGVYLLKSPVESFSNRVKCRIASLSPSGFTPATEAYWAAAQDLCSMDGQKKVVVMITDGLPDDYRTTQQIVELLRQNGVIVLCIAVGSAFNSESSTLDYCYGEGQWLKVPAFDDLCTELLRVTKEVI